MTIFIIFEMPRDEIFASEEQEKKINLEKHQLLYRGLQEVTIQKNAYKLDRSCDPPLVYEPAIWYSASLFVKTI